MKYQYHVELVAYNNRGNEMMITIPAEGYTLQEVMHNATLDAKTLLRDKVTVLINGLNKVDEKVVD